MQGADAAAQELGTNIDINYFYGGQFYGDANITSRMEGWYSNGTQVVFACGGGIYTSAVEAALKNNGYVIGVDVDQNYIGVNGVADGSFAYNPFITSAMKGLTEAVNTALSDIEAGDWSDIAASNGNFGLEDGDYIGLPTDADSWNFETFTTDEYEALKSKIKSGEITVDNSSDDSYQAHRQRVHHRQLHPVIQKLPGAGLLCKGRPAFFVRFFKTRTGLFVQNAQK